VSTDTPIVVSGAGDVYVGRGGLKLEAALDSFGIDVEGRQVLDAGASTGGFTDCLLRRGAVRVVAVDVGYGQLHPRLASDPRVEVRDRTNLRQVTADAVGGPFDLVTVDLSFISVCTVASVLADLVRPGGDLVVLVKPQFEVGKGRVGKGGIVRDPALQEEAVEKVSGCLSRAGFAIRGVMPSPIRGSKGNQEWLLWAKAS
jgi:23S rRNA (cytidine1920-2'-O)/16S rRNA (cytidine1409-2'-O)-methyltransferase